LENHYLFFIGRQPLLSLAEILSFFDDDQIINYNNDFVGVRCEKTPKWMGQNIHNMGGVMKIALVKQSISIDQKNELNDVLTAYLEDKFKDIDGKKRLGMSVYKYRYDIQKNIKVLKKRLKATGMSLRFVNRQNTNLSTDQIIREKLISEKGCELNIVKDDIKLLISETIAVQDIDKYSLRDFGRPGRDARRGMLPPKLAQIMLNLGRKNVKNGYIWDPFCGTGVTLMEGLLMGYNMLGTDIDEKAIYLAEKNLVWLYEQFGFNGQAETFTHDATMALQTKKIIECVVTEPLLGPPLHKISNQEQVDEIRWNLENLYLSFFNNLKSVLHKNALIVMIFPCFRGYNKIYYLDHILGKLEKRGFKSVDLISPNIQEKFHIKLSLRKSLLYIRPDHVVGREIFCFKMV